MAKIYLKKLLDDVFEFLPSETITVFYDSPSKEEDDNFDWKRRRETAVSWFSELLTLDVKATLASYDATMSNNADLPEMCTIIEDYNKEKNKRKKMGFVLSMSDIVIALTEFSSTAPLHAYAKKFSLRAASMPGYNDKMADALNLDYNDVAKKVSQVHSLLKKAQDVKIKFSAQEKEYSLDIDVRHRNALKDDGNCKRSETIINLPSGEAFMSPYEGEKGEASRTCGELPIEDNGKVKIYMVKENRIVSCSERDDQLMEKIKEDSAVGNIAEIAFGVLGTYGIKDCGEILLDEKLGMHIALGRDDHFGGINSPDKFRKKENVWHHDYVYTKEMQPKIKVKEAKIVDKSGDETIVIRDDKYLIF